MPRSTEQYSKILKYTALIVSSFLTLVIFVLPVRAAMVDGENALDLLGQYDWVDPASPQPAYLKFVFDDAPNRLGFELPQGSAIDSVNHRLFVSDGTNGNSTNRVLVYNLNADDTFPDRIPDFVLGEPDFSTSNSVVSQATMNNPYGLAYDAAGQRLFVADSGDNRVLIFNVATIINGQNAVNVLGQSNFTSSGIGKTQTGMNAPRGLAYDSVNKRLFIADSGSNRVLVYNVATVTDGEAASNVLGQTNFTLSGAATTQAGMSNPGAVAYDTSTTRLFVAQSTVNRVTIFNVSTSTIADGENAANVLGQTTFTGSTGSNTAGGTSQPAGLAFDSATSRLFVALNFNARITVFDLVTTTDGENAINILGQTSFAGLSSAVTQSGVSAPKTMTYDSLSHRLFVPDLSRRVEVFDVASITDGENMVDLLGQYDGVSLTDPQPSYTKGAASDGPNRLGFNSPLDVTLDTVHHRFFVLESANNRVLVYNLNSDNTFPDRIPDAVLGQANFVSNVATTTQSGFNVPSALVYDAAHNRLFVAQSTGNRVSVFDVSAITNGKNAANVLGQTNFTSLAATTSQSGMSAPQALAYDAVNDRLFVGQSGSNRVTTYNTAAVTDGMNAANVLGQVNFTSSTATTTPAGMNSPSGLAYDTTTSRLFVAQSGNNRVTVFDLTAIADGQSAVNVLGQTNFSSSSSATTQGGMNTPRGLIYDAASQRLFVAQSGNNRVTTYDVSTITNGKNATHVFGQLDFISGSLAKTQSGLFTPRGIAYDPVNSRLFVAQSGSNRVSVFDALAAAPLASAAGTPVISNPTLSTLDLGLVTNGNDGTVTYAIFNNTTGGYVTASGTATTTAVYFASSSWTGTVGGLAVNTAYQFSAIARNSDGVNATTSSISTSTFTRANPATALAASNPTISSLDIAWGANGNPTNTLYALYNSTAGTYVAANGAQNGSAPAFFSLASWVGSAHSLLSNTAYRFSVVAENGNALVAATSSLSIVTSTLPLPAGTPIASNPTTSTLGLVLDPLGNPSSSMYTVYNLTTATYLAANGFPSGGTPVFFTTSSWNGTVFNLALNTSYQFEMVSQDGSTSTASAPVFTLASPAGTPVVTSPTTSTLNLLISTNSNPAATTYAVYNSTVNSFLNHDGSSNGASAVFFLNSSWDGIVTGLNPDTGYQLSVISRNGDGITSTISGSSSPLSTLAMPAFPVTTLVTGVSTLDLEFNSNGNPASTAYAIYDDSTGRYVDFSGMPTSSAVFQTHGSWGSTISVGGLSPNTSHQMGVIARSGAGLNAVTTTASTVVTFADVPAALNAQAVNPDSITLAWSGNATEYYAENSTAGTTSGWVTSTSFTFSNLGCSATYFFQVKGRNSAAVETSFSTSTLLSVGVCSSGGPGTTVSLGALVRAPFQAFTFSPPTFPTPPATTTPFVPAFPAVPYIYPPVPVFPLPLNTTLFPTSGIKFIVFPVSATLQPNHVFSFTYSYANPFSSRQIIKVARELRSENNKPLVLGNGSRTLRPSEKFTFKATQRIPKTTKAGNYILVLRVLNSRGKLIDQNAFRITVKP